MDGMYYLLSVSSSDLIFGGFDEACETKEEALQKLDQYRVKYPIGFSATLRHCKDITVVKREVLLPKKRSEK